MNEELAECKPLARILFIGLWCLADREGRLEYRPKKIKAEILPYDNANINELVGELEAHGFISMYVVDEITYVQVVKFTLHQYPHVKEKASTIPAPCLNGASTGLEQGKKNILQYMDMDMDMDKGIKGGVGGKEENPPEQPEIKKGVFGQFKNVLLFPEEVEKLEKQFGTIGMVERIENLSEYLASKGVRYKSHYATILSWERKNGPVDKKGVAVHNDDATKAWLAVMSCITSNTPIEDERSKTALEAIGGRGAIRNAHSKDIGYIQKNFEKNYNAIK